LMFKFLGSDLEDKRFCTEWQHAFSVILHNITHKHFYQLYIVNILYKVITNDYDNNHNKTY
jgi:hypothetical protein